MLILGVEKQYIMILKIGRLTSGGFSVVFNKSIGMGYIDKNYAACWDKIEGKNP